MHQTRTSIVLTLLAITAPLTVAYATGNLRGAGENSYYLFTSALRPTIAGVIPVPSRFKWSVETSWRGVDVQGRDLPDSRVLLRLYDPDHNFTALTAQMDLETAEKLQRELAEIIAKKRQNPGFQHRPALYDPSKIPTGRLQGINDDGTAVIELRPKQGQ